MLFRSTAEESPNQIYMITGVRGSGKTVMMTNIASEIRKRSDEWIIVELNPNRDLLQSLAAKIYAISCSGEQFAPQYGQNFVESGICFPHFVQNILIPSPS